MILCWRAVETSLRKSLLKMLLKSIIIVVTTVMKSMEQSPRTWWRVNSLRLGVDLSLAPSAHSASTSDWFSALHWASINGCYTRFIFSHILSSAFPPLFSLILLSPISPGLRSCFNLIPSSAKKVKKRKKSTGLTSKNTFYGGVRVFFLLSL